MAAKGGESKTGLIVSLIFAILLVIGLGVAAYYGYADQEDLRKKAKDSQTAADTAKKSRDWHHFLAVLYKSYLGAASKQDLGDLSVLRGRYESGGIGKGEPNFADNDNAIKRLDDHRNNLGWNMAQNQPANTAADRIATMETEIRKLKADLDSSQIATKQAEAGKNQANESAAKNEALLTAKLQDLNKQYLALAAQRQKEFLDLRDAYAAESKKLEDAQRSGQTAAQERDDKLTLLNKELDKNNRMVSRQAAEKKELEDEIRRVRGLQDPVNPLESGPSRGKIVRLDRSGNLAWINLGSADNLRAQVRFSVFKDKGDGKPTGELKASLQISEIVGPHLAKAQVTYTRDANRDPLLAGDLLFNPTWNSSYREHVAVAGLIDLSGLGTDNTAEFMRALERQGVDVDAYVDLKDLSIKGKGMTTQTTYLILGDNLEHTIQGLAAEGAKNENIVGVNKKIDEMKTDAAKLGIQTISFRRYLVLTGHRAPRGIAEAAAPGTIPTKITTAPEKKEKKEEKEAPKKEAPKKDDGK